MGVRPGGFYARCAEPESARAADEPWLRGRITVLARERKRLRPPQLFDDMHELDERCGKHRVARLMRIEGRVPGHDWQVSEHLRLDHIVFSQTRARMELVMGATMAAVMPAFMLKM